MPLAVYVPSKVTEGYFTDVTAPGAGEDTKFLVWNNATGVLDWTTQPTVITDHTLLSNIGTNTHAQIDTHIADTANPHAVTAASVGGTIYVHNDSGDTATLYTLDGATISYANTQPLDAEDMAYHDGIIYVADSGRNAGGGFDKLTHRLSTQQRVHYLSISGPCRRGVYAPACAADNYAGPGA